MYCHIGSQQERVPMQVRAGSWAMKEAWEGQGLAEHKCDLAQGS